MLIIIWGRVIIIQIGITQKKLYQMPKSHLYSQQLMIGNKAEEHTKKEGQSKRSHMLKEKQERLHNHNEHSHQEELEHIKNISPQKLLTYLEEHINKPTNQEKRKQEYHINLIATSRIQSLIHHFKQQTKNRYFDFVESLGEKSPNNEHYQSIQNCHWHCLPKNCAIKSEKIQGILVNTLWCKNYPEKIAPQKFVFSKLPQESDFQIRAKHGSLEEAVLLLRNFLEYKQRVEIALES